jgi:hypothetical protein
MIISVAAAVLFIANIFRRGWVFPIIAVGLWGFISIVVGTIYPAYVQRFKVQPNEYSKEQPYITRNIAATRAAFGLDKIQAQPFNYTENLDQGDITENRPTLDNARLWDQAELKSNVVANQAVKTYLTFQQVDYDRYPSGINTIPALIAVRQLNPQQLPSRTWTNTHLVYTHGYGAVVAAGNTVTPELTPSYLVGNIPPSGEIQIAQPEVYFGEGMGGFAVVHTKVSEIQPSASQADTHTTYEGNGGVAASSFVRKAALALRFGSWDLFVSGQLTHSSRVLYNRDIVSRVQTAAPFLQFDANPYPVLLNGRIVWVIDGYTTSDRYPYSQALHPSALPNGSGLDTSFNYVRNSVKATVDAYDGTVKMYIIDPTDPIVKAYSKAFHREDVHHRPDRPDREGVRQGLPEAVQQDERDAGGPPAALAVPRGHVLRPDGAVLAVPHDRPEPVLQQGRSLGHLPRAVGDGCRGRHDDAVDNGERQQRRPEQHAQFHVEPDRAAVPNAAAAGPEGTGVRPDAVVRPARETEHPHGVHRGPERSRELREARRLQHSGRQHGTVAATRRDPHRVESADQ